MSSAGAVQTVSKTTGRTESSKPLKDEIYIDRTLTGCDSTMMVSIESYEGRVPKGAFVSFYSDRKYEFQGLDQMLLIMEDIMDSVSKPWPFLGHRSLYEERDPYVFCETGRTRMDVNCAKRSGTYRATFVIRVYYRQHGSMQGELVAAAGKMQKKVAFRSALELMRLLYEYLDAELGK